MEGQPPSPATASTNGRPEPSAQGAFAKTPFPHLLIYALERGLSGTFELHVGPDNVATMLVLQGFPAKLRIRDGVHYLGQVMQELGFVTPDAHAAAVARMQASPCLYGQALVELGAIDANRLAAGVRAQLERKAGHLFTLPPETIFSYYDGVDGLQGYGGQAAAIDPLPVLWRGIRSAPPWEHVDATLRRVGGAGLRLAAHAQLERFQLDPAELTLVEQMRQRSLRIVDVASAKLVAPSVVQPLVYLLVITKQVDLVEAPSVRPPPPVGQAPAQAPGSAAQMAPGPAPGPASSSRMAAVVVPPPPSAPNSGQAFARVQLAKSVARPLVVEEAPVARSAADNRIASPVPQQIALPAEARAPIAPPVPVPVILGPDGQPTAPIDGLDIHAMISTTIQSSLPPSSPMLTPGQSFAPVSVVPEPPPSVPAELTAEQSALKQKIVERAAAISAQDYFQMLGLDRDAQPDAVQKAFFALAKVWHPDRLPPALIEVKDECSRVFTHLTEAHATLTDTERRSEYMTLLKDGGATPDDQAKIQAVLEAAMEFQKAEILLKRNDVAQAHELARKAHALDPEQADYLAMVTWLDAQKPEWTGREKTLEKVAILDRCIKMSSHCERAYFWRGMLYKRIDEQTKAIKDFKKSAELNPRNLDALREVRLHNMRGGQSKPPPGAGPGPGGRTSQKPPAPETIGGLFGKLFKK